MRIIRASEIGSFLYCRRAWFYQRQGVENENQPELVSGTALHTRHGLSVALNSCLQTLAYLLLLASAALLTFHLVNTLIP